MRGVAMAVTAGDASLMIVTAQTIDARSSLLHQ